jgi:phosphatidylglycerophosphatase A
VLGLGRWPWAPGTLTSAIVTAAVYLLGPVHPGVLVLGSLAVALLGMRVVDVAEAELGPDATAITIDEVAGMLLTLSAAPHTSAGFGTAFLLFRVFDILKPPPASHLDRLRGARGVIADDLVAGCYAVLLLLLLRLLGHPLA